MLASRKLYFAVRAASKTGKNEEFLDFRTCSVEQNAAEAKISKIKSEIPSWDMAYPVLRIALFNCEEVTNDND